MADTTLQVRLLHPYKTEAQWLLSEEIPKSGEILYTSGGDHDGWYKIGDGTHVWSELDYISSFQNAFMNTAVLSTDSTPYTFRPTPDSSAKRASTKIVGGTVAWNQLLSGNDMQSSTGWGATGATINSVSDGVMDVSFSGSGYSSNQVTKAISLTDGHVFFSSVDVNTPNTTNVYWLCGGSSQDAGARKSFSSTGWNKLAFVWKSTTYSYWMFRNYSGGAVANVKLKNPLVIDLTQMFGSTIADYLYTLESSSSGSGIAKLREWGIIDDKYHAYDAGSLQSVKVSALERVGFNQWDEEWEPGRINVETGENSSGNGIRSKTKIPVLPSTNYYGTRGAYDGASGIVVYYYDASENFVSYENKIGTNVIFNIPSNARFIRINVQTSSAVTYNHDICINISDPARNGTYEPYHKYTTALDPIELRGIYKLDASNNLYADGDVYESDGTVTRKYGIVDLGTLNWSFTNAEGHYRFTAYPTGIKEFESSEIGNIICSKYTTVKYNDVYYNSSDKIIGATLNLIAIVDFTYTDADAFKTAMSGVYLFYELATPTTETADPFTNPHRVEAGGTEAIVDASVTAGTRDIAVPMGHETKYLPAVTLNVDTPTRVSDFINDAGYLTANDVTDTKNTAGSTNNANKLFLVGATEQTASAQTYSNSNLYYSSGLRSIAETEDDVSRIIQTAGSIQLYVNDDDADESLTLSMSSSGISLQNSAGAGLTVSNNSETHLTNVVTPTNNGDVANKKYVDDSISGITHPVTSVNGQTGAVSLTIPAAQVQSNWNATSGMGVILNKPTNVSNFTNDAGYLTLATLPKYDGTVV